MRKRPEYQLIVPFAPELRPKIEIVASQRGLPPTTMARWVVTEFVVKEFDRIQLRARREERSGRLRAEFERRERRRLRDIEAASNVIGAQAELQPPTGVDHDVPF